LSRLVVGHSEDSASLLLFLEPFNKFCSHEIAKAQTRNCHMESQLFNIKIWEKKVGEGVKAVVKP
jgi:hypothetical protein